MSSVSPVENSGIATHRKTKPVSAVSQIDSSVRSNHQRRAAEAGVDRFTFFVVRFPVQLSTWSSLGDWQHGSESFPLKYTHVELVDSFRALFMAENCVSRFWCSTSTRLLHTTAQQIDIQSARCALAGECCMYISPELGCREGEVYPSIIRLHWSRDSRRTHGANIIFVA